MRQSKGARLTFGWLQSSCFDSRSVIPSALFHEITGSFKPHFQKQLRKLFDVSTSVCGASTMLGRSETAAKHGVWSMVAPKALPQTGAAHARFRGFWPALSLACQDCLQKRSQDRPSASPHPLGRTTDPKDAGLKRNSLDTNRHIPTI